MVYQFSQINLQSVNSSAMNNEGLPVVLLDHFVKLLSSWFLLHHCCKHFLLVKHLKSCGNLCWVGYPPQVAGLFHRNWRFGLNICSIWHTLTTSEIENVKNGQINMFQIFSGIWTRTRTRTTYGSLYISAARLMEQEGDYLLFWINIWTWPQLNIVLILTLAYPTSQSPRLITMRSKPRYLTSSERTRIRCFIFSVK